jgi:predicted nucleic acid-binding protein
MVSTPPNSTGAVVIDANVMIAICAKEAGKETNAKTVLAYYVGLNHAFYAPGVAITETLYILCQQHQAGLLTAAEHAPAVQDFAAFMAQVLPTPHGEAGLIMYAERFRAGYGCSRSADGIYLALAEHLANTAPTTLLTFDIALRSQATLTAPSVNVHLLTI